LPWCFAVRSDRPRSFAVVFDRLVVLR